MKAFVNKLICVCCVLPLAVFAENYPAELAWAGKVNLSMSVSGVVEQVNVVAGQVVDAGTVMLALESPVFKANVAAARAQFKSLSIDLEEAQREYNRAEELYASTVLSDRDLHLAEIAYEKVNAQYHSAKAHLTRMESILSHSVLKAPYDAIVIDRQVMPGEALAQDYQPRSLLTIARRDAMLAFVKLPVESASSLELGETAQVTIKGDSLQGKVTALGLQPQQGNVIVEVEFTVPEGKRFIPGMKAEVELP